MDFIQSPNSEMGISALADTLQSYLNGEGGVLWLVSGGSNIPLSVIIMNSLQERVSPEKLSKLTVALTDERYGPIGHSDSNWKQLLDAGFACKGINTISVLTGQPLEETVDQYARELLKVWKESALSIGQFGIGSDGHIAGVLPHTIGVSDNCLTCGYNSGAYIRITLTLSAITHLSAAYAFVFGPSKHDAIARLTQETISLDDMPAQILRQLSEAFVYTDQIKYKI